MKCPFRYVDLSILDITMEEKRPCLLFIYKTLVLEQRWTRYSFQKMIGVEIVLAYFLIKTLCGGGKGAGYLFLNIIWW